MTWNPQVARLFFRESARDLGDNGYQDDCEMLRASAGALYWALDVDHESLYGPEAFREFVVKHVGWSASDAEGYIEEILADSEAWETKSLASPPPQKTKAVRNRFSRPPLV